jgi:hypothetical protein
MLREQMFTFFEAAVIFLLLTNALSIFATVWALYLANRADVTPTAIHMTFKRFFDAPLSAAGRTRSN